jgi:hypothetical protein
MHARSGHVGVTEGMDVVEVSVRPVHAHFLLQPGEKIPDPVLACRLLYQCITTGVPTGAQ